MATIRKRVENLRPGKEYILTVRAKNNDVNVTGLSEAVRFTVPADGTIPNDITGFYLFAGFEQVMFVFDASPDPDFAKYEYQLYDNSQMTGTPVSGFSSANIFTVSTSTLYQNSNQGTGLKVYHGRVRSIDTTGNEGSWTDLVASSGTPPLIDEQYVGSITASKITAGTITGQTITLAGNTSIIKSSNYSTGQAGWQISGDGSAEFDNAKIRGTIDIGTDPESFHVDIDGNMWVGSGVSDRLNASFNISNSGNASFGSSSYTVTSAVSSATIVYTVSLPTGITKHNVSVGQYITVTGLSSSALNVSNQQVTAVTNTTITITKPIGVINTTISGQSGTVKTTGLFISNNGSITIGSSFGDGPFQVSQLGEVTVGTSTSSQFKINSDGSVRIGNQLTASSLRITNTGAIAIGSNFNVSSLGQVDIGVGSSSVHIDPSGNLWSGSSSYDFNTNPFAVTAGGDVKARDVYITGTVYGTSDPVLIQNGGYNYRLNPTEGFVARLDIPDFFKGEVMKMGVENNRGIFWMVNGQIFAPDADTASLPGYSWRGDPNTGMYRPDNDRQGKIAFASNGTERFRIGTGGVTVIGNATITGDVTSSGRLTGSSLANTANSFIVGSGGNLTANTLTTTVQNNYSTYAGISSGGVLGKYSSSSRRYKNNIIPLSQDLDAKKLLNIEVVQFKYNDGYLAKEDPKEGETVPGLIAEDVYEHYPAACIIQNGQIENWSERLILAPMLKLVQELFIRIDKLERRIDQ